jgi:uncharacterized damage-inducible protein DinB
VRRADTAAAHRHLTRERLLGAQPAKRLPCPVRKGLGRRAVEIDAFDRGRDIARASGLVIACKNGVIACNLRREGRAVLTTDTAVMLARYNDWADRVLFAAIRTLPERAVYESRKTLFGSMIGTLNHNHQVDLIWRAHLRGEQHGFSTRRDLLYPDFDALVREQADINSWYIDWAAAQDSETLGHVGRFTFVSGKAAEMTKGGMFLHIINHKTYHRGWVAEMFFAHDMNPPETDLCVYLTEA